MSNYKLYVLVEDDGLEYMLNGFLPILNIPHHDVKVISGRGWTKLFSTYEQLTNQTGISPGIIIPVLDADTIQENRPKGKSDVLDNPNLFRLNFDLEFAFDNWILAEALINLNASPFESTRTPTNFSKCQALVQAARVNCVKNGPGMYKALDKECKAEYSKLGKDPTSFVLPSKMEIAKAITEILIRTNTLPDEIKNLVQIIAKKIEVDLALNKEKEPQFPDLNLKALEECKPDGKVLLSIFPKLFILDFDKKSLTEFSDNHIARANWSPDGKLIASEAKRENIKPNSVLLLKENGEIKGWVSRQISTAPEAEPCWFPDGNQILVRTEAGSYIASLDAKNWKQVYKDATAFHCVSINGRIVRTTYDQSSGKYFAEVGKKNAGDSYLKIPHTTHVEGAVSWSSSGMFVAFANMIDNERGAVCIYDVRQNESIYITSHNGSPYFICYSPDERFVLYTWRDASSGHRSLRLVEIGSGKVYEIFHAISDIALSCHCWKV
jgi:WD40 repeat protein